MNKIKKRAFSNKNDNSKTKNLNSHGYDVSKFSALDIPVRRDPKTGRLISTNPQPLKKGG